jgi:hypothetical protein
MIQKDFEGVESEKLDLSPSLRLKKEEEKK